MINNGAIAINPDACGCAAPSPGAGAAVVAVVAVVAAPLPPSARIIKLSKLINTSDCYILFLFFNHRVNAPGQSGCILSKIHHIPHKNKSF